MDDGLSINFSWEGDMSNEKRKPFDILMAAILNGRAPERDSGAIGAVGEQPVNLDAPIEFEHIEIQELKPEQLASVFGDIEWRDPRVDRFAFVCEDRTEFHEPSAQKAMIRQLQAIKRADDLSWYVDELVQDGVIEDDEADVIGRELCETGTLQAKQLLSLIESVKRGRGR